MIYLCYGFIPVISGQPDLCNLQGNGGSRDPGARVMNRTGFARFCIRPGTGGSLSVLPGNVRKYQERGLPVLAKPLRVLLDIMK